MSCRQIAPRGHVLAGVIAAGIAILAPSSDRAATPTVASNHSQAIVDLVAKVMPTVVSIAAHRVTAPLDRDPKQAALIPRIRESVGSGFVVDPKGYIATNRHVVDGAYEIVVTFSNGRALTARLVFKSSVVDLAFLKVEADKPLPAVTLAPIQSVRVGERVIAIGNPLSLGISVSAGIVSALDRNIKESPYDAFIQTDAAINHGSSGGPLFNEAGEVVGINTALFTSTDNGGSQGLGFAIPGRDIAFLIDQLKRYKAVRVGWLGAHTQKLTPDMAEALGYPDYHGAIIATVDAGSSAARAGLRPGDIVRSFEDQQIFDTTTLSRAVGLSLGKTVTMEVWRDGAMMSVTTALDEADEPHGSLLPEGTSAQGPRFASTADMGFVVAPIDAGLRERFALKPEAKGLLVTTVSGGSAAQEAGIRAGDVVVSAQLAPVASIDTLDAMIREQAGKGRTRIVLLLQAPGGERWVALPLRL